MIEPILAYLALFVYLPVKVGLMWLSIAMVPIGALVNAVRGGRYLPEFGTAKKMWLCAAILTALATALYPLVVAGAIGLAYVIWDCLLPWGRWFSLNRIPRDLSGRAASLAERWIEKVSDLGGVRRDRVAFFLRNLICLGAGAGLFAFAAGSLQIFWLVPIAALAQNIAYDLGWFIAGAIGSRDNGISYSEHLMGATWGAAIGFGAGL